MLTFIPTNIIGCQSLINCEKGDIIYLRALGGISQAKIVEISTTISFDYTFAWATGEIYAKFLLPDGSNIVIDSTDDENWRNVPKFYQTYEDCRQNRNQLGYTIHRHVQAGNYLINLIKKEYGVDYRLGEFIFHAPTKSGVRIFPATKIYYHHNGSPLEFDIYKGKYLGTVDELREHNIHTTHESALARHRPKLVAFEDEEKPKYRKIRVVRTCEVVVPADEVEDYIQTADEIEMHDWTTKTEVIE